MVVSQLKDDYRKGGQYSKVNTSIRIKKDSIIWISLKALFRIRGFKINVNSRLYLSNE